ncbi:MAG: beta-ketoacyl-[acyl-carrier-protein] synthase family protein [Myxococcales bacterium]
MHLPRVFVTGVGAVSPIGTGKTAFFRALEAGLCGIGEVCAFDAKRFGREYAAEVRDFVPRDHLTAAEARTMGRCSAFTVAATRMAVADAGLEPDALRGPRTIAIVGTTMGEARVLEELDRAWIVEGRDSVRKALIPRYGSTLLSVHAARAVGAEGLVMTLPAACAAGNYAIGLGSDLLRSGRADVAIAGASEVLQALEFAGFVRIGAMAPRRCQPFDRDRQGLILGEGSGVLVLETEEHMVRRHARPLAEIGGYGLSCDGYHITRPHPDAAGSIAAMRQAIAWSGLTADDVDFVNAHGTGTQANDAAEAKVMKDVFGARRVPISSMKGMLGHCMGAASALEAISCVMTLETGLYPPTIGHENPDPECDLDVVTGTARQGKADVILNNSLAFGGYNAVLCLARPGVLAPPAPPAPPVEVRS